MEGSRTCYSTSWAVESLCHERCNRHRVVTVDALVRVVTGTVDALFSVVTVDAFRSKMNFVGPLGLFTIGSGNRLIVLQLTLQHCVVVNHLLQMNFTTSIEKRKKRKMGSRVMEVGDTVIIFERHDSLSYLLLQRGRIYDNKFGTFHHNDFIGKHFGSRVYSKGRSGWVYALEPSPELWSHAMHTRTQIVDESDASFVTFTLDVYPGCKVWLL